MEINEILKGLEKVRSCGCGWSALCPAHDDRNPSLRVREGEKGILMKCWAGCQIEEICEALNIQVRDLFFEPGSTNGINQTRQWSKGHTINHNYHLSQMFRDYANKLLLIADGFYWHADAVLNAAPGKDISNWSDTDLENAWEIMTRAYQKMRLVEAIDGLAFDLRSTALNLERKNDGFPPPTFT